MLLFSPKQELGKFLRAGSLDIANSLGLDFLMLVAVVLGEVEELRSCLGQYCHQGADLFSLYDHSDQDVNVSSFQFCIFLIQNCFSL